MRDDFTQSYPNGDLVGVARAARRERETCAIFSARPDEVRARRGGEDLGRIADGTDPAWAPDDREVYYRSGARLMAARIDRTTGFRVLSRRVVIAPFLPPLYDGYDVHPDGRTLAIVRPAGTTQAREVTWS